MTKLSCGEGRAGTGQPDESSGWKWLERAASLAVKGSLANRRASGFLGTGQNGDRTGLMGSSMGRGTQGPASSVLAAWEERTGGPTVAKRFRPGSERWLES